MNFEGVYKASKVIRMVEGRGMVFVDLEEVLAQTEDIDTKRLYEQTSRTLLIIDAECNVKQAMEVPEGTPVEELEKAKKRGMEVTDDGKYLILQSVAGKVEDGALYMYDKSTFLSGSEWVKLSTDTEDELNLVTTIYKKI